MEKIMFLDYVTLQIFWWLVIGFTLSAFALLDGFDLGIAAMMPWVAKSENERRIMLNTVGPVWESNQVWLVVLGGTLFAVFPQLYAMSFSGFYYAMFMILLTLVLRPVVFKFRSKIKNTLWRSTWDTCLIFGGTLAPVLFGVALGNILMGVPLHFDDDMRGFYEGGLLGLLRPFPLLAGCMALAMCLMQGGLFLAIKTESGLRQRAQQTAVFGAVALLALYISGGVWLAFGVDGYVLAEMVRGAAVTVEQGAWLRNYDHYPALWLVPIFACTCMMGSVALSKIDADGWAFLAGSASVVGIVGSYGASMFPFLMPSNIDPIHSLTIWNASSSHISLFSLFLFGAIFIPLIMVYVSWVYRVMSGKVNAAYLMSQDDSY